MRNVSITLQNNEDARPIIEAIRDDNPEAEVQQFPAMVKINSPGKLVINRETVEQKTGQSWDPQEIHMSLISLSGNIDETDDQFILEWSI